MCSSGAFCRDFCLSNRCMSILTTAFPLDISARHHQVAGGHGHDDQQDGNATHAERYEQEYKPEDGAHVFRTVSHCMYACANDLSSCHGAAKWEKIICCCSSSKSLSLEPTNCTRHFYTGNMEYETCIFAQLIVNRLHEATINRTQYIILLLTYSMHDRKLAARAWKISKNQPHTFSRISRTLSVKANWKPIRQLSCARPPVLCGDGSSRPCFWQVSYSTLVLLL